MFDGLANVELLSVNYEDEDELAGILKSHTVDTVVSCVNPPFPDVFDAEKRLVRAASRAGVKRFAASQFCLDYEKEDEYVVAQSPSIMSSSAGLAALCCQLSGQN